MKDKRIIYLIPIKHKTTCSWCNSYIYVAWSSCMHRIGSYSCDSHHSTLLHVDVNNVDFHNLFLETNCSTIGF